MRDGIIPLYESCLDLTFSEFPPCIMEIGTLLVFLATHVTIASSSSKQALLNAALPDCYCCHRHYLYCSNFRFGHGASEVGLGRELARLVLSQSV